MTQQCQNCGKPKEDHIDTTTTLDKKTILECEIARDDNPSKNYRFKPEKQEQEE